MQLGHAINSFEDDAVLGTFLRGQVKQDGLDVGVGTPETTLRGGQALVFYDASPPFDPAVDAITDTYLVQYADGLTFLDAALRRRLMRLPAHSLDTPTFMIQPMPR